MENEIYLPAPRDLMVNEEGDIRDSVFSKGIALYESTASRKS